MIQTVEGRLGGGKTYMVMGWIINHLRRGGVVATNINIQELPFSDQYGEKRGLKEVLKCHYQYDLHDGQIIHLSDIRTVGYKTAKGTVQLNEITMFYKLVPRGTPDKPVFVVIDEAHIHFPQSSYKGLPREVLNFLTLSRHACVDVVFISQHIKNMWCQMNRLAEYRWSVRDMKKYGFPVSFLLMNITIPWPFPHMLQCKYDYDGLTLISRKFEWVRRELFETYKSPEIAAQFESMDVAASVEVEKKEVTVKEKFWMFAAGLAAGLTVMLIVSCHGKNRKARPEARPPMVQGTKEMEKRPAALPPAGMEDGHDDGESLLGYCFDTSGAGAIYTDRDAYHVGDRHCGRVILRIVKDGYLYMDGNGQLLTHKFKASRPRSASEGTTGQQMAESAP